MVIDYNSLDNKTSDEIDNMIVEITKEMIILEEDKYLIREHLNELKKERIILEGKMHEYMTRLNQAAHVIKQRQNDLKILESKFWKAKRGY